MAIGFFAQWIALHELLGIADGGRIIARGLPLQRQLFERVKQHLLEAFALWNDPFVIAARQQIATIERDSVLERIRANRRLELGHVKRERRGRLPLYGFGIRGQEIISLWQRAAQLVHKLAEIGQGQGLLSNQATRETPGGGETVARHDAIQDRPAVIAGGPC